MDWRPGAAAQACAVVGVAQADTVTTRVEAEVGFWVIAVNELVRPTEFEQADGFHGIRSKL